MCFIMIKKIIEYYKNHSILTNLIMTSNDANMQGLQIKDCEILHIATGVRAQNLEELKDELEIVHPESIYFHFWAKKLSPGFEEPEFNNDFANWAHAKLHNNKLAERLSLINPGTFSNVEDLRSKLLSVIETTTEKDQLNRNSKDNEKFQFTRAELVLINSGISVSSPQELTEIIPTLPMGSMYFHFIESQNGPESIASFISNSGEQYSDLSFQLSKLDPYFFSLKELQSRTAQIFKNYFQGQMK